MSKLSIDIAVGGRFHADYLAAYLHQRGHKVRLHTTYPRSRFPRLPRAIIRSFLWPEIAFRVGRHTGFDSFGDQLKMRWFGGQVSKRIKNSEPSDLFIAWSSFALETLRAKSASSSLIVRDSTHIDHQTEILREEHKRFGIPFEERPICRERELSEYELADRILVLSRFAKQTFVDRGIADEKIHIVSLGVNTELFRPLLTYNPKLPIKVVYFGTLSLRKGVYYLLEATKGFSPMVLELYLVGPVEAKFRPILEGYNHAKIYGPMAHPRLAEFIRGMDVYVFPTLEDGFPNTLIQAMASGLIPVTTQNCGPAELIVPGETGYFIPERSVEAILATLNELIEDPQRLSTLRRELLTKTLDFTWERYGSAVVELAENERGISSGLRNPHRRAR